MSSHFAERRDPSAPGLISAGIRGPIELRMFALFRQSDSLELIRGPRANPSPELPAIELAVDRFTLAKRRWRGQAADGREFGFDLERPLRHGEVFFATNTHSYVIAQTSEPVLLVAFTSPSQAAHTAWQIGNMHFPVEVRADSLLVEDDPILRALLEREGIAFTTTRAIFQPVGGAAAHRH
jgi:urease accessory protein